MKTTAHTIRHWTVQILRRTMQVSIVLLMVGLCYLSLYGHRRATHTLDKATAAGGFRAGVLARYDEEVESMDDPRAFLDANEGTIWSMQIYGVEWTDPLAAAEPMAVSRRLDNRTLWLSILIPVLLTLVLGKVFCSWMCPANLLFEITGKLRHLLRFAEIPPAEVKFSRANKYVLLAVGLLIATVVGLPIFALIYPPAVATRLLHGWIFETSIAGALIILGLIVVFETRADHDAYQAAARHQQFIDENSANWKSVRVFDVEG